MPGKARFHTLRKESEPGPVPPAEGGSERKINSVSARLKSCPDTGRFKATFFPACEVVPPFIKHSKGNFSRKP